MCYPKPGPRCSAHAKKRYIDLRQKLRFDIGKLSWDEHQELEKAFEDAEFDFDSTPVGQARLELRIKQGMDLHGEISERLENARKMRSLQLAAIKAKDAGDVNNHKNNGLEWHTGDFLNNNEPRKNWAKDRERKSINEYIECANSFAQSLSTEESTALYWHTSDGASIINGLIHKKYGEDSDKWNYKKMENSLGDKYSTKMIQNQLTTLNQIFTKNRLKEPAILYRGLGNNLPDELQHKDVDSPEMAEFIQEKYSIGETITVPGYMSTSADPAVAHNFCGYQSIVLEVKTTQAVPVGMVSAWNTDEREFVVNRGGKYKVVSILKNVTYEHVWNDFSSTPHDSNVTVIQLEEIA